LGPPVIKFVRATDTKFELLRKQPEKSPDKLTAFNWCNRSSSQNQTTANPTTLKKYPADIGK
jgi:hypothetical protein